MQPPDTSQHDGHSRRAPSISDSEGGIDSRTDPGTRTPEGAIAPHNGTSSDAGDTEGKGDIAPVMDDTGPSALPGLQHLLNWHLKQLPQREPCLIAPTST